MEWNGPCENNEKSHARHQHPQEASRFFPSAWKRLGQASILSKNAYAHSLIHFFEMKNFFEYKEALHFHPLKLRKKKIDLSTCNLLRCGQTPAQWHFKYQNFFSSSSIRVKAKKGM